MLTGPLIFPGQLVGEQTGKEEGPICGGRRPTHLFGGQCTWSALARSTTPPSIRPSEATGLLHYKLAMNLAATSSRWTTAFTGWRVPERHYWSLTIESHLCIAVTSMSGLSAHVVKSLREDRGERTDGLETVCLSLCLDITHCMLSPIWLRVYS